MSEATDQTSRPEAPNKPAPQQLAPVLTSNTDVEMTGTDNIHPTAQPNPQPSTQATPSSVPTPLPQVTPRLVTDTFEVEVARSVAKRKRETAIYDEFEKMHGRRPPFNEVRDDEVRRGVPLAERIFMTVKERTSLSLTERLESAKVYLGPEPSGKVLEEWKKFWKVLG